MDLDCDEFRDELPGPFGEERAINDQRVHNNEEEDRVDIQRDLGSPPREMTPIENNEQSPEPVENESEVEGPMNRRRERVYHARLSGTHIKCLERAQYIISSQNSFAMR